MARRNNRGGSIGGLYGGDARGLYGSTSYGRRNTMIYGKPRRRWPKFLLVVVVLLVVILCIKQFACGGLPFFKHKEEPVQQEQVVEQQEPTTVTITAVGDILLGCDPQLQTGSDSFTARYAQVTNDQFLKRVTRFTAVEGDTSELTIANLEGPLTTSEDRDTSNTMAFTGLPEYASILTYGGIDAVNLANDSVYDYGSAGYEETKSVLESNNVQSFGYDRTCVYEVNGVKVGLFGLDCSTSFDNSTALMNEDVAALQREGCAIIVGYMHWGTEGEYEVSAEATTLAHAAIDAGCDLIVGSHPHVMQGIERYNDRYIVYSLGNFCYGGNESPMDFDTMMWQQTFTVGSDGQLVIDDTTSYEVCVIPCRISSTSSTINDYTPNPQGGDTASEIIAKLNELCAGLASGGAVFDTDVDDAYRAHLSW